MKSRFILLHRACVYYTEDTLTRKQHSLRTKDDAEALTLLHSKNEAHRQPVLTPKDSPRRLWDTTVGPCIPLTRGKPRSCFRLWRIMRESW